MIGRLIGNYKILEKVGEGGMGAVWRGIDIMLDREVAIKMLKPELASNAQIVERFRAEAMLLARLSHPNIAMLYTFMRQGNDFFMVMEYVRGETLSQAIERRGAMPWQPAIEMFCQTLEGVQHAHALGIIHRDLKPANVMLTPSGSTKVMDFGIARALSASRMTRTGHLIGTLEYMAPELIQGQGGDLRSDIYALGLTLYEMLTGRLPFDSHSDYELMRAQIEAAPMPPRQFAPHLPLAIEQAMMRALAKRPEARFQTAAELRTALLKPLAGAALADGPKETRLAGENLSRPLAAPRLPQPSPDDINQAAATGRTGRRLGLRVAAFLNHLDWRHYAGFGALLLAILSAPFFLVSKSDRPSAMLPASTARPQLMPAAQATSAAAPTSAPVATPPASAIKNQLVPAATGSDTAAANPPPRARRARRSSDREARPPAKARRSDNPKKDEKEPEKKDKEEKKGGIFRKLKKLNPFGHGDKKKD